MPEQQHDVYHTTHLIHADSQSQFHARFTKYLDEVNRKRVGRCSACSSIVPEAGIYYKDRVFLFTCTKIFDKTDKKVIAETNYKRFETYLHERNKRKRALSIREEVREFEKAILELESEERIRAYEKHERLEKKRARQPKTA